MPILLWPVPRHGPDHPVYALLVVSRTLFLGPALGDSAMRLPPRWFRVPQGERVLHRILGVGILGGLLGRSGYNRSFVHPGWDRWATMPAQVQGGCGARGARFAIQTILAVLALLTGHRWGAFGLVVPGVLVHLYPALLQRLILLRMQPLLEKLEVPRTQERQNGLG